MNAINEYLEKYGIKESQVYLLELIPLIEMIWADGHNQEAEINLLYRFTIDHLSKLHHGAPNTTIISDDDINDFLDKFTHQKPPKAMLEDLRSLCLERINRHSSSEFRADKKESILNYCLDIAAACVKSYPYEYDERIIKEEKLLLSALYDDLLKD